MLKSEYCNLTDLFLDQASEYVRDKQFKDAANLIVMAITEFDDQTDIPEYLSVFFETIPQPDVEGLIVELSKEMMWLCPRPYISHQQRSRMLAFKDRAAALFEKYHFRTASDAECQHSPDGEHPHVPAYMFALEKKENTNHPQ